VHVTECFQSFSSEIRMYAYDINVIAFSTFQYLLLKRNTEILPHVMQQAKNLVIINLISS
jgi:hypothetical protein